MGRPKRAPTREVKISEDLAAYLEDLGKVWGMQLRDMVDAAVGDFYLSSRKSKGYINRVMLGHISRTDAKVNYRYLDDRGLAKMRARRDKELRDSGLTRQPLEEAPESVPDWLK